MMEPSQLRGEINENEKLGKIARSRKMFPDNFRRFPNFPFLTLSNGYNFPEEKEEDDEELDESDSEDHKVCGSVMKKSRLKEDQHSDPVEPSVVHISNNGSTYCPIQRDSQKAGTITIYPQGYHIAWKGNSKGKDCLHDPEGHRYCYYVNEGSNYCKPTDREAFWQCSGRGMLTKRPCGVIVREVDGIFSQYSIKAHLAEPHLPKGSSFNGCHICVERHGHQ